MGDCLWGTPGIRALKKCFPSVGIDLLIQPKWQSLYYGSPYIRRLIPYHPQWYRQLLLLPQSLRIHYDHTLIFHANKDIGRLLPWLKCSSIWAHQKLPNVSPNRCIQFAQRTHPIMRRAAVLLKAGVSLDGAQMDVFLNDSDLAESINFLKQHQMAPKEFIYLNTGASLPHKQYPTDRTVLLAKHILKTTSLNIVLGGGPNDASQIDSIENQLDQKRVTRACHRTIRANCALISQARLMITTDTGPMHIGFALKVPTIALFGPTRPEDSGPFQIEPEFYRVLRSNALDTETHASPHKSNFFDSITVDMVWKEVNYFLDG